MVVRVDYDDDKVRLLPLLMVVAGNLFVVVRVDYDDDKVRLLPLLMVVARICLRWLELIMMMIK